MLSRHISGFSEIWISFFYPVLPPPSQRNKHTPVMVITMSAVIPWYKNLDTFVLFLLEFFKEFNIDYKLS